jgi:hypothetical protein
MRGIVSCRLVGGPQGDETMEIPARFCGDSLRIEDGVWFEEHDDGSVSVMKGDRRGSHWTLFQCDIYEKEKPVVPGNVTYRFTRSLIVHRCAYFLEAKGRRCKNEALEQQRFCRAHKEDEPSD